MKKEKLSKSTVLWSVLLIVLCVCYVWKFLSLNQGLSSLYDEGFFYTMIKTNQALVTGTQPLSLSTEILSAFIPNLEELDVLSLRRLACVLKISSILLVLFCSSIFLRESGLLRKFSDYLFLSTNTLLVGLYMVSSSVINMNDVLFILTSIVLSVCLIAIGVENKWLKRLLVTIMGMIFLLVTLNHTPAGIMMFGIFGVFLCLYDGFSIKKAVEILACLSLGLIIGVIFMHFVIISIPDLIEYVQTAITQTTSGGRASHHSLTKVILVIFFGFRDLIITVTALLGITYFCNQINKYDLNQWLCALIGLMLFFILNKWLVKPSIYFTEVITWVVIMFMQVYGHKLTRNEIVLIIFLLILPIGISFGTNTNILGKALSNIAPWGMLMYIIFAYNKWNFRPYAVVLYITLSGFIMIQTIGIPHLNKNNLMFTKEKPIARMSLSTNQHTFYSEVNDILKENGYRGDHQDTLLGFCFNEMTIVAMDAIPYTNDQQPEEFLLHDLDNLPCPRYIIFSEWDSIVLHNRLSELDWGFPQEYNYHKCVNNANPNSGYKMTQSMIYCRERE